jgi:hypothetical protein
MRSSTGLWLLMCLLAASPLPAFQPKGGPVYLDPDDADEDFQFQGEYHGWQAPRGSIRSIENVALQVVAEGDGRFQAVKYFGGLPGQGWQRRSPQVELEGERSGGLVQLAGEDYDIVLDGQLATVYTHEGERIGELRKVDRISPTMGAAPPPGAIVLFNGASTDHFEKGKITDEGWLMAGADTKRPFGDFRLHGEFRLPYKPKGRGQDRGNSGFYLQSRYELQVLDSFGPPAARLANLRHRFPGCEI